MSKRWQRLLPGIVFIVFLLLYVFTAAPSIVELFDDSLEFQFVLPTFGIAHPTGYPLYTLVGGVWSHLLPFGNWAWRVNIFSAVAAAGAVALVFVLTQRLTARNEHSDVWGATAAAIAFGFGEVWWSQATVAEVYAMHNLLVAAILALALSLPSMDRSTADRRMALMLALVGLGLAHHRMIVLLLPGLAIYLLWTTPTLLRPRRVWLIWLAALLTPLLLYAYIPLRAAQGVVDLNGGYVNTWAGFWDHVLARRYTSFFAANELTHSYDAPGWLILWREQMGWMGVGLSVLGLGALADRRRRSGWVLIVLVLAANLIFTLNYRVGDPEVFLLPVFLCTAVLAGGGLALIRRWLQRRFTPPTSVMSLLLASIVLLLLGGIGRSAPVNRSADWFVHDYAVDMATVTFPENSRVIGIEGEMTALRYMQRAEQLGLAATPVVANAAEDRRSAVTASMAAGAPVYLTRELEGIDRVYSFTGEGPLVRVWPRGVVEERAPSRRVDLSLLDGRLLMEGYDLERLEWAGGPVVRITLYWRPLEPVDRDLKVSLRVVNEAGEPKMLRSGLPAVTDAYPLRQVARTPSWEKNIQVRDVYETKLPDDLIDAAVLVIVYDADTLAEVGRLNAPVP
ncbi:MAG: hypothetical protein BroJett021_38040 [Chloroflexota bacterium]|nr:MAG: hypothetical protein BroJett021_38040 [Chloroflexota bacterium]